MNTEIFIKASGDATFARIDLESGVPLPVTYNVLDIRNPQANISHWSKTLKFPGTKSNNILFQHIFEIGIDGGFNPNKKADCYIIQDSSVEVFRGVLQLLKITRREGLDLIYYECCIFGGSDDIFTKIADAKLTDLDFSAYDHVYNRTNQTNSWSASVGSGYVYPMIDYNGRNPDTPQWYVKDFFPALYAKEYIDKIFTYAGKTYTSTFLTSDFFKRLIIPFNKEQYQYSDAEIEAKEFRAERITTPFELLTVPASAGSVSGTIIFQDDSAGFNYDPSLVYNPATGIFTVQSDKAGRYSLKVSGTVSVRLDGGGGTCAVTAGDVDVWFNIKVNGNIVQTGTTQYHLASIATGTYADGTVLGTQNLTVVRDDIFLQAGDQVWVEFYGGRNSGMVTAPDAIYVQFNPGGYFINGFHNVLVEDATVAMNSCIPEGIQMRDYFLSIINMFRLYVEEDKDVANNYIIEPRDTYYQSTRVDWSDKLDYKKGLEIIPMAELQGRRYTFKYKEDTDYWNGYYQKKYLIDGKARTFGDKIVDVDNDFVTNEVVTQLIFSPTQSSDNAATTHNRVIPCLFHYDNGEYKQIGTNIRILYWSGLKSFTGTSWEHWSTGGGVVKTQYPYAGHLDDPFTPTLDLCFDVPKEVQWRIKRATDYKDANLYNTYHKRAIEEIIDPDARLVIGWFRLTPVDIFQLSFRKLYYFHNEVYRLNKVVDYDFDEEKLTKCEFIKANDPGAYVPTSKFIIGGPTTFGDGTVVPRPPTPPIDPFGNYYNPQENTVVGNNNNVPRSATGIVIQGDDNVVGAACANVLILGDENVIFGGQSNVRLIQCSGLTITESDVLYINNCQVEGCITTDEPTTETISSDAIISATSEVIYVDTSAARSITLPTYAACQYEKITVIDKTGGAGANNITVNRNGTDTIRLALTHTINTAYGVTEYWKTSDPGVWTVK